MKKYLLGILSDGEASVVEERYFIDKEFFARVKTLERELVASYLDGRLDKAEREAFKKRYFATPALRQLVESVEHQRAATVPAPSGLRWAVVCAGVVILLTVGVLFYKVIRAPQNSPSEPALTGQLPAEISLHLHPGVKKDGSSQMIRWTLPPVETTIHLALDLPNRNAKGTFNGRIIVIGPEGQQRQIWAGPASPAVITSAGLEVSIAIRTSVFAPGDYLLDLAGSENNVKYSYLFRVIREHDTSR